MKFTQRIGNWICENVEEGNIQFLEPGSG